MHTLYSIYQSLTLGLSSPTQVYLGGPSHRLPSSAIHNQQEQVVSSVCCDSREAGPGSLFVARKGALQDGHRFINQTMAQGCRYFIVDAEWFARQSFLFRPKSYFIVVEDTEAALFAWAQNYRRSLAALHVLAVSGSYGKTTSKELIASILRQKYRVFSSPGNRNAPVGCALSVLSIPKDTEVAVLEMGIDHPGEMELLCRIAQPNSSVLTAIGSSHMEFFTNREELAREKAQIFRNIQAPHSAVKAPQLRHNHAFLPSSDPMLPILEAECELTRKEGKELLLHYRDEMLELVQVTDLALQGQQVQYQDQNFRCELIGRYQKNTILLGILVAKLFGLNAEQIAQGCQNYHALFGRSQLLMQRLRPEILPPEMDEEHARYISSLDPSSWPQLHVLQDAYNASPESVFSLVEWCAELKKNHDINVTLVLGDMKELGSLNSDLHRYAGTLVGAAKLTCFFYGESMYMAYNEAKNLYSNGSLPDSMVKLFHYSDEKQLASRLHQFLQLSMKALSPDERLRHLVVFKGARSMHLEKINRRILL